MICQKCDTEIKDAVEIGEIVEIEIGGVKDRVRICKPCNEQYRKMRTMHVREIAGFLLGLK